MNVLYEDNHLLVVCKRVGLATMGLAEGEETLLTVAKEYIKRKYNKPGNVYLGVVSRLDVPVSGVVLFARTSKAADRINQQFRDREVDKDYLALVEGAINPKEDECVDWIAEDKRHRQVWVTQNPNGNETKKSGGDRFAPSEKRLDPNSSVKEAKLTYKFLKRAGQHSLISVQLGTGRKHQIRLQLAHRGFPILGDRKYGSKVHIETGITLHAEKLSVKHPITGEELTFTAPVPDFWKKWL
ncbi:MAG: RluA family pseudouridine synthase [Thermoguttaceae bacterium]